MRELTINVLSIHEKFKINFPFDKKVNQSQNVLENQAQFSIDSILEEGKLDSKDNKKYFLILQFGKDKKIFASLEDILKLWAGKRQKLKPYILEVVVGQESEVLNELQKLNSGDLWTLTTPVAMYLMESGELWTNVWNELKDASPEHNKLLTNDFIFSLLKEGKPIKEIFDQCHPHHIEFICSWYTLKFFQKIKGIEQFEKIITSSPEKIKELMDAFGKIGFVLSGRLPAEEVLDLTSKQLAILQTPAVESLITSQLILWEELKNLTPEELSILSISSYLIQNEIISWKELLMLPEANHLTIPIVACIAYAVQEQKMSFKIAFDLIVNQFKELNGPSTEQQSITYQNTPLNLTEHFKIWFSKNPDVFFGYEINKFRLIQHRLNNPSHKITVIIDKTSLSGESLEKLDIFSSQYEIEILDLSDLAPYLNSPMEKELCELGKKEVFDPYGKKVSASDIIRTLILGKKIYSDFDVQIKWGPLKEKLIKQNFLVPYDMMGRPNNCFLAFLDPNHDFIKSLQTILLKRLMIS